MIMSSLSASPLVITAVLPATSARERSETSQVERVCLSWHDRHRSRQRLQTDRGTDLCLALPRGTVLRDGDLLYHDHHRQIWVRAQGEELLRIYPESPLRLAQIAHHLGNWHRSVQILEDHSLLVQPDPPLRAWLQDQGLPVETCCRPFDPNLTGQGH